MICINTINAVAGIIPYRQYLCVLYLFGFLCYYLYYLNQDDVSDLFLTADPHIHTQIDRHTLRTPHTHGRCCMVPTQFRSSVLHTHKGLQGWANRGENKGKGAETQGYIAQAQGPKGGFWVHTLEGIIAISMK